MKKKICMVGQYAVGKTSLVRRFVHSIFDERYQTSIGVKIDRRDVTAGGQPVMLLLWDIAGEDDLAQINVTHLRGAAGYILVVDGCRSKTLETALSIQQRVENEIGPSPFLLLANKADERSNWEIPDATWQQLKEQGWTVLETSAKTGQQVEEAFLTLAARILQTQHERQDSEEDD